MRVSHIERVTFNHAFIAEGNVTKMADELLNDFLAVPREPPVIAVQFISDLYRDAQDCMNNRSCGSTYLLTYGDRE